MTTRISEEKLDEALANEAMLEGWAEDKVQLAIRILKYVSGECDEREMKYKIKDVLTYLDTAVDVERHIE